MDSSVDFKKLPVPELIEDIKFEDYKSRIIGFVQSFLPTFLPLENDDYMPLIEAFSYELMQRDIKTNDKIKSLLSPFAVGNALDLICYTYYGTRRLENEIDTDFLTRSLYSLEQSVTTGALWSYKFFAESSNPLIKDVNIYRETTTIKEFSLSLVGKNIDEIETLLNAFFGSFATVHVVIFPFDSDIETDVIKNIFDDKRKTLTDNVIIKGAKVKNFTIDATLRFDKGVDRDIFINQIKSNLETFKGTFKIGKDVSISQIYKILQNDGVDEVILREPKEKITVLNDEILALENYNLSVEWSIDE